MDEYAVSILGTMYDIHMRTSEQDETLKNCAGYCDHTHREIVIESPADWTEMIGDPKVHLQRILRHEIIHAFLFESGLGGDATYQQETETHPETLVDWFARQHDKIHAAFKTVESFNFG